MLFGWIFGIVFVLVLVAIVAMHLMIVTTEKVDLGPLWKTALVAAAIALLVALLVTGALSGIAGLAS